MKKKKHNLVLIPREKIIMGGPMNVFIRCKNKGCIIGIDWMSLDDPKVLLERANKEMNIGREENCPYKL